MLRSHRDASDPLTGTGNACATHAVAGNGLPNPAHGTRGPLAGAIILIGGALIPWISFIGDRWIDYCFPAAATLLWIALARGGVSWSAYFKEIPRFLAITIAGLVIITAIASARVYERVDVLDKIRLIVLPGTIYLCLYTVIAMQIMRDWPLQRAVLRAVYIGIGIGCILLGAEAISGGAFGRTIIAAIIDEEFAPAYFNRAQMMLAIVAWTTAPVVAVRYGGVAGITVPVVVWVFALFGESEMVQTGLPISIVMYLIALRLPRLACDSAFAATLLAILSAPFVYPVLFDLAPTLPLLSSHKFLVRAEIWDAVSRFALDAPLTGHGIRATRLAGPIPIANLYYPDAPIWHPHNGFLQLWVDLGVFGVLCVAGIIAGTWRTVRRLSGAALPTVVASFTLVILAVISTHTLWATWWLGFIAFNTGYLVVVVAAIRSGMITTLVPGTTTPPRQETGADDL